MEQSSGRWRKRSGCWLLGGIWYYV